MNDQQFGALLGFAFTAAWVGFGFGEAILCLLVAGLVYALIRLMAGELELGEMRERVEGARSGFHRPRETGRSPSGGTGAGSGSGTSHVR